MQRYTKTSSTTGLATSVLWRQHCKDKDRDWAQPSGSSWLTYRQFLGVIEMWTLVEDNRRIKTTPFWPVIHRDSFEDLQLIYTSPQQSFEQRCSNCITHAVEKASITCMQYKSIADYVELVAEHIFYASTAESITRPVSETVGLFRFGMLSNCCQQTPTPSKDISW